LGILTGASSRRRYSAPLPPHVVPHSPPVLLPCKRPLPLTLSCFARASFSARIFPASSAFLARASCRFCTRLSILRCSSSAALRSPSSRAASSAAFLAASTCSCSLMASSSCSPSAASCALSCRSMSSRIRMSAAGSRAFCSAQHRPPSPLRSVVAGLQHMALQMAPQAHCTALGSSPSAQPFNARAASNHPTRHVSGVGDGVCTS
jgi:hypothetical protein